MTGRLPSPVSSVMTRVLGLSSISVIGHQEVSVGAGELDPVADAKREGFDDQRTGA